MVDELYQTWNGARLRAIRELLGFTQKDLANQLCVSRQTVINWEKSEDPLPPMLQLSCLALMAGHRTIGAAKETTTSDHTRRLLEKSRGDRRSA